jgi:hypothetical protein
MKIAPKNLLLAVSALLSIGCTQQLTTAISPTSPTSHSSSVIYNKLVNNEQQVIKSYAQFVPIREDDFAWENDLVAFRMYGPSSLATPMKAASGIDCWLKRVDYSIIDKWYENYQNNVSYHKDWGEGYDPYHTGVSRGTGGTALWIDGIAYPAGTFSTSRIIDNNPKKIVFELDYVWQTKLGEVSETKQISLALGSQLFEVTSSFLLNGHPAQYLSIAIGIATHDEAAKVSLNKKSGWIAAWEKINGFHLGTGVVITPDKIDSIIHLPSTIKDQSHIWLITHTNKQGQLNYAAGYGWERAEKITTEKQWQYYLSEYSLN